MSDTPAIVPVASLLPVLFLSLLGRHIVTAVPRDFDPHYLVGK